MRRFTTHASRALNAAILALSAAIGIAAFLYPFFRPGTQTAAVGGTSAHSRDALLMFIVLIILCLGAVLSNMLSGSSAKMVAMLGMLTAVNAALRAVPGPLGFSAIFALPIFTGYCYGATFGYLLGTLSLATSALLGAGVGPWLPYQMFTIGWVGLTSAWLPNMRRHPRLEVIVLALWGATWGMTFGLIMNVWFWPFVFDPGQAEMYWQPGLSARETVQRYLVYYALTSSWWDAGRALGNAALIAFFGAPVLRLLRRFGARFTFYVERA